MNLLRALLVDSEIDVDGDGNLTVIHNESAWGHRFERASLPTYETIKDFQKHQLSLASLSLKGFRKMSHRHASHLLPLFTRDFHVCWSYGLLNCLADLNGDGHTMFFDKMLEYSITEASIPLRNGDLRVNGRTLLQKLHSVGRPGSPFKMPSIPRDSDFSPFAESFLSIAEIEKESRRMKLKTGFGMYQGYEFKTIDGRTPRHDFEDAERIERILMSSAFMGRLENADQVEWGTPVIPEIMKIYGHNRTDESREKLSKTLVYLFVDVMKICQALRNPQEAHKLLGKDFELPSELDMEIYRYKFGLFLESLVPATTYIVFCGTVKDQRLLSRTELVKVLQKLRTSRRILFKIARDRLFGKPKRPEFMNLSITHDSTIEEVRDIFKASMSAEIAEVTFVLRDEVDGEPSEMDMTTVDALLKQVKADELEVVTAVGDELPGIGDERGNDDGLLSYAGAGIVREGYSEGIPVCLPIRANASEIERMLERMGVNEEGSYEADSFGEDTRWSNKAIGEGIIVTPTRGRSSLSSDGNSAGSDPFSSTKVSQVGRQDLGGLIQNVSAIPSNETPRRGIFKKRPKVAPTELTVEKKFYEFLEPPEDKSLEKPKDKLTQGERDKLAKYVTKLPVGVKQEIWRLLIEVIGDELLNGVFMIKTAKFNRAAAAVLITRYLCQWANIRTDGPIMKQEIFDKLMFLESKWLPKKVATKRTSSNLKFMKEKIRTTDSIDYILKVLNVIYPNHSEEAQKVVAQQFIDLCTKQPVDE